MGIALGVERVLRRLIPRLLSLGSWCTSESTSESHSAVYKQISSIRVNKGTIARPAEAKQTFTYQNTRWLNLREGTLLRASGGHYALGSTRNPAAGGNR